MPAVTGGGTDPSSAAAEVPAAPDAEDEVSDDEDLP